MGCALCHSRKAQQDGVVQKEIGGSTLCGCSTGIEVFTQLHRLKLQITTPNDRMTVG